MRLLAFGLMIGALALSAAVAHACAPSEAGWRCLAAWGNTYQLSQGCASGAPAATHNGEPCTPGTSWEICEPCLNPVPTPAPSCPGGAEYTCLAGWNDTYRLSRGCLVGSVRTSHNGKPCTPGTSPRICEPCVAGTPAPQDLDPVAAPARP
jgi:hypothetical protein